MPRYHVLTSTLTDLGAYRITLEYSTRHFTVEQAKAEQDCLTELFREMYNAVLGAHRKRLTAVQRARMVAKMKATREARGIEYQSGRYHWTARRRRGEP